MATKHSGEFNSPNRREATDRVDDHGRREQRLGELLSTLELARTVRDNFEKLAQKAEEDSSVASDMVWRQECEINDQLKQPPEGFAWFATGRAHLSANPSSDKSLQLDGIRLENANLALQVEPSDHIRIEGSVVPTDFDQQIGEEYSRLGLVRVVFDDLPKLELREIPTQD